MTLADALLHIIKLLPSMKGMVSEHMDKDQEKAVALMMSFTECLEKLADELQEKNVPEERCAELRHYLDNFAREEAFWKGLSAFEIDGLYRILREASIMPSMMATVIDRLSYDLDYLTYNDNSNYRLFPSLDEYIYDDEVTYEQELRKIKVAVGKLRAMKNMVSARR